MNPITFDSDQPMNVLGVPGRLTHRTRKQDQSPGLWFRQRWISEKRRITGYGVPASIRVEMRFDDEFRADMQRIGFYWSPEELVANA